MAQNPIVVSTTRWTITKKSTWTVTLDFINDMKAKWYTNAFEKYKPLVWKELDSYTVAPEGWKSEKEFITFFTPVGTLDLTFGSPIVLDTVLQLQK